MANQVRNFCITVNNPTQTDEEFEKYLKTLDHIKYFAFGREKGDGTEDNPDGTVHFQLYIEFEQGKTFATMKKYFPTAHIEPRNGTKKQARDYVFKIGKYLDKAHTKLGKTFEDGTFAEERERTDITDIIQMVKDGASDEEIEDAFPSQMFRYPGLIEKTRYRSMKQKYENIFRKLNVTYIWGAAGSGKSRYVMDKYGYKNVYRITNYENPFDSYAGQNTIIFEEFRSSLKIEQMLNYLDGYPLELPARYADKIACFENVYIITNISLNSQYVKIQMEQPETWKAFLRRIHYVWQYDKQDEPIQNLSSSGKSLYDLTPVDDEELDF